MESDKQAAPVSAPPDEVDVAHDNVGRAWTGDKHRVPERDVPSKVSAGEVKRWDRALSWDRNGYFAMMVETGNGKYVEHSDYAKLQERIATLEAELKTANLKHVTFMIEGGPVVMASDYDKLRDELAAYKASLPERANADSLNAWSAKIHELNAKWWVDLDTGAPLKRNVGELLMLCVSELAEAMEGDRKNLMDDKLPHRKMFEVELADCMIRIFDIAAGFGLDLGAAVVEKCEYNKTRADHQPEARKQANGKKY